MVSRFFSSRMRKIFMPIAWMGSATGKRSIAFGFLFLLSGCGTLKVHIDYGNTPPPTNAEIRRDFAQTLNAIPTWTHTPTISPIPSATPTASVTPLSMEVTALAVGYGHTCALTRSGAVWCWGLNDKGQLGDGSRTNRPIPVEVRGLSGGVAAIAAGGRHTCALTREGGVKCWGENQSGQLGDGTLADHPAPVDVVGLNGIATAVAAGAGHTCALIDSGAVQCWGWDAAGQLGDGKTLDNKIPVNVKGLDATITAVAAGYKHTCALTEDGEMRCWGLNAAGQLGDGTTTTSGSPVSVVGLGSPVLSLSAGDGHTCALMKNHAVKCWGDNSAGQLGDDTGRNSAVPVPVIGLTDGALAVSAGSGHTCAVTESGPKCWGRNLFGQLGNDTLDNSLHPVAVVGFSLTAVSLAVGGNHTCGVTAGGGVRCWGNNAFGQLGDGTTVDRSMPVDTVGWNRVAVRMEDTDRELAIRV
jgi:alpha-tubulin suppressor-like RCC1 family protein